jgi:hypothetical protein
MRHLTYANVVASLALFLALTGGSAIALRGTDRVDSGDIRDGEVRTRDLAGPEPEHVVGARGEPRLVDRDDCKWTSRAPELPFNPPSFYRDPFGIVHLAGVLQVDDGPGGDGACDPGDGAMFVLPPGYRPAHVEVQVVQGGPGESLDGESSVVIGPRQPAEIGGEAIAAGSVSTIDDPTGPELGSGTYVLDGISFRAAP